MTEGSNQEDSQTTISCGNNESTMVKGNQEDLQTVSI